MSASSIDELHGGPDHVRDALVRDYLIELLGTFESLSISAREALWRENDALASIHIDQIRLVGRELVVNSRHLGGAQ
jgi:hypothetical protein